MADKKKADKGTFKKVMTYIGKYRLLMFLSIVMAALTVALTLYVPVLIGDVIDLIIGKGQVDFKGIAKLLKEIALIAAATAAVQWLMNTVNNRITYHIVRDMRNEAFMKIQKLPLSYLDIHPAGETVNRVIADADQFADGLLMGFTQLFTGVVTILATLIFMLTINWKITLTVVILTPLSLFIARFIAKKTYAMFRLQSETRGEQTAFIDEMISNQKVVQAFCHEDEAMEKFDEINDRLQKCSLRATFFSSLTNPTTRFVNNVVYAAVALTGAIACVKTANAPDPFTVGMLSVFLSYANQYTKPFNEISGVVTELQNALACASRLFELIEEEPQIPDADDAKVLENAEGRITLDNVAFSYVPDKKLIEDLTLSVEPGQRVALVGPTGCGKTTIINLLMRFYDVNSGEILIDGVETRSMPRHELRKKFGMVLQETWLFKGTIMENIRYGRLDATDEEVIAAAKAAHAHRFISALPGGYQMELNEEVTNISQGQKQLLTIARAILANNPVLILDEATSSVDTRTEHSIQRAMDNLMKGRTSFVIAHRLSTIKNADIILVMKDGDIIEQGNHEELMAQNGFYAELYNSQFEQVS